MHRSRMVTISTYCAVGLWIVFHTRTARSEAYEVDYQENVEYGTGGGEKLTLHLAKPKGVEGRVPCIVFIHGGGWRGGSKDMLAPAIKEEAARGYLAASVGYRFAPKHRFPAQIEDVKCAVRWLRAHANELNLDRERIGAIGYSAGAHLSMMLGAMDSADGLEGEGGWGDQSSKVQAVVAYFGPTNLVGTYPPVSKGLVADFIGGPLEEKKDLYERASPITYVNEGDAPMLLFQGTKDVLVPYDQAFQMATSLTNSGVPGRVEVLLGAGHGWGNEEMKRTHQVSRDFFDKVLKKGT